MCTCVTRKLELTLARMQPSACYVSSACSRAHTKKTRIIRQAIQLTNSPHVRVFVRVHVLACEGLNYTLMTFNGRLERC